MLKSVICISVVSMIGCGGMTMDDTDTAVVLSEQNKGHNSDKDASATKPNHKDAGADTGVEDGGSDTSDAFVCITNLPPSCQSGVFNNGLLCAPLLCLGTYYPPGSLSGNGGSCGGGLVEGPGDGTDTCYCLPNGGGAPNSGCPLDGQLHYYINSVWQ